MAAFNIDLFFNLLRDNPGVWAPIKDELDITFFEGLPCSQLPRYKLKKVNALYDMYCNLSLKEIVRLLKLFKDIYVSGQNDFSAQVDVHNAGMMMKSRMYDFYHDVLDPNYPGSFDEFGAFSNIMFGTANITNYGTLVVLTTPDKIQKALISNTTIIGKLRQIETNWNEYHANQMANAITLDFEDVDDE